MGEIALPEDYEERVYAGWLGKLIGVRLGAPVEGWTYEEIAGNLGEVREFLPLPRGKIFKPDDDSAFPMILIRALEDYGPDLTPHDVARTWLNYLGDQHGTLWWGGYGVSTEHTAYLNLANGIPAPLSGSASMNGVALSEQIGGQIFSDVWGLVAPSNPELAARYAAIASSVSHDGEGINGGRFIAALVSLAFTESDPMALVERGLEVIPPESEYARVVEAVLEFHRRRPGDWREAYRFVAENFGYDRYSGAVPIVPNAGIVVLALLYGNGDFSESVRIATNAGWDTDCNAGNVGAIMGVAVGIEGIPESWRKPMNDSFVAAGIIGTRNLPDVPHCADLFSSLGRKLYGVPGLQRNARYHFSYPGSTHGFRGSCWLCSFVDWRQETVDGEGALRVSMRALKKKGEAHLFVRTSYRPEELSSNYYGASFSPRLYPGQIMRASVRMSPAASGPLRVSLYARDRNSGTVFQGGSVEISPGANALVEFRLPEAHDVLLEEAGIALRNVSSTPWSGALFLLEMDWGRKPCFDDDFSLGRNEFGAASQWTYLRGFWRIEDGAYHGSGVGVNETYTGDVGWKNYTFTVRLVPLIGDYHNVNVRVQGALRSYAVGLAKGNRLVLYKNAGGYREVLSVPFRWEHGRGYEVSMTAKGNELTVSVDGEEMMKWQDESSPFLHGQVGLSNFAGCHTRYEYVRVC